MNARRGGAKQQGPSTTTKHFTIQRLLGKGTYGAVYKVQKKDDGETYALKEVSLKALKLREREDAVNEVRVLASIKHSKLLLRYFPRSRALVCCLLLTICVHIPRECFEVL